MTNKRIGSVDYYTKAPNGARTYNSGFSYCCGANYMGPTSKIPQSEVNNRRGILVLHGDKDRVVAGFKQQRDVIKTRLGDFTVIALTGEDNGS